MIGLPEASYSQANLCSASDGRAPEMPLAPLQRVPVFVMDGLMARNGASRGKYVSRHGCGVRTLPLPRRRKGSLDPRRTTWVVSLLIVTMLSCGVRGGWIDPDTKDEFKTITSLYDGAEYELVSHEHRMKSSSTLTPSVISRTSCMPAYVFVMRTRSILRAILYFSM